MSEFKWQKDLSCITPEQARAICNKMEQGHHGEDLKKIAQEFDQVVSDLLQEIIKRLNSDSLEVRSDVVKFIIKELLPAVHNAPNVNIKASTMTTIMLLTANQRAPNSIKELVDLENAVFLFLLQKSAAANSTNQTLVWVGILIVILTLLLFLR